MSDFIKDIKKSVIITAALSIVLGIILIIFPEITGNVICYALGSIAIIGGLINVIRYFTKREDGIAVMSYDLAIGLILCGIGLFMIMRADVIIYAIPYVFGLLVIIDGFVNVQRAFDLNRFRYKYWWISLLCAIVSVGLGILMLFNPFEAAVMTMIVIGIAMIYNGIIDIYIVISIAGVKKRIRNALDSETVEVTAVDVTSKD